MGRLSLIAIVGIATLAQKFTPRTDGERQNLRKLRAYALMAVPATDILLHITCLHRDGYHVRARLNVT